MSKTKQFKVRGGGALHSVGDECCEKCWGKYPLKCRCGGLFHSDRVATPPELGHLVVKCDRCGSSPSEEDIQCRNGFGSHRTDRVSTINVP